MGQMSINPTKLLRGLLLLILTWFMMRLVKSGDINLLVSPMIALIVKYSVIPLILITVAMLKYSVSLQSSHSHDYDHHQHHEHHHDHPHGHGDHCDCGHDHTNPDSFWGQVTIGLFFVSLAIAYSWQPKAFGTEMIANASTQTDAQKKPATSAQNNPATSANAGSSATTNSSSSPDHTPYAPGIIDVNEDTVGITKQTTGDSEASIAMRYGDDPKKYWGKQVELDGFVYHPQGLPKNYFVLTRFFIFCCVADASPIGITVESNDAGNLKNDTWVHVTGAIEPEQLPILDQYQPTNWFPTDSKKPVILAKTIEEIPTPQKPYMIPY